MLQKTLRDAMQNASSLLPMQFSWAEVKITIEDDVLPSVRPMETHCSKPCRVLTVLCLEDAMGERWTMCHSDAPDPSVPHEETARVAAQELASMVADTGTISDLDLGKLECQIADAFGVAELINFGRGCYD
jgi:hypothetical protein